MGVITRGTTNPNRLRRCDRWLAGPASWRLTRSVDAPVVVDLGYGASPVTAVELHDRLRRVRSDVEVVGIEIDPERVAAGALLARPGLSFRRGGFEVPLDGRSATVVRAFNVLRQYSEDEVAGAWSTVCERLTPDGLLVDGTCDELGRLSAWVAVEPGGPGRPGGPGGPRGRGGPVSLTLSWHLRGLDTPSVIAERLPKALIHRNVPGEAVHDYLADLDRHWARSAGHAAYGVRQRFLATAQAMRESGWPLLDGPSRWRLGELTVAWDAVAPRSGGSGHQGP